MAGQIVVSPFGQTTCVHHRQIILDWYCETCRDPICAKCISTTHKGHIFVQLSEVTSQSKHRIKTFINENEPFEVNKMQQEISTTRETLKRNSSHFERLEVEVRKQNEKIKEELDVLMAQTLSQLKQLEEKNSKILILHQTDVEKLLQEMRTQLKQCKETLQIGTDIQVFDLAKGLFPLVNIFLKPDLVSAKFCPQEYPDRFLRQAIGTVALIPSKKSRGDADHQASAGFDQLHVPVDPYQLSPKQTSNDDRAQISPTHQTNILPQGDSKSLTEWKAPCDISCMCPASDGSVWICDPPDCHGNIVTLLTWQAGIGKQIRSPVKVTDICTSPVTSNLWACSQTDNSVLELVSDTFSRRFTTKEVPISLWVYVDHILVGTTNKITKYSLGGYFRTATKTRSGKSLVFTPHKISQCPLSGNISVVDRDWSGHGGTNKPHITVMDKNLQRLHQYGREQHTSRPGTRPFDPIDLTYEGQGRLVISDFNNHCLHLLSGTAQYLRLIHTDKGLAQAVSIDSNNDMWAVFGEHGNQIIKRLHNITL